jgi:hypothetical protein
MINPSEYSSIDCATEKTFNQKRSDDHVRDDNVTKRVRRDLMAGSRPRPIVPKSLSEAYRIAQAVCAAKMAPKGLDTPEACMIVLTHRFLHKLGC